METWAHTVALSLVHCSKEAKKKVEQILEMVLFDLYKSTEINPFSPKESCWWKGLEKGRKKILCVRIGQVFVTQALAVHLFSLLSSECFVLWYVVDWYLEIAGHCFVQEANFKGLVTKTWTTANLTTLTKKPNERPSAACSHIGLPELDLWENLGMD